ncbi:MAG: hypothetical protein OXI01_06860 [Albidovulum sp.]|nr:hypothetical protein [Albidovulum sp.]
MVLVTRVIESPLAEIQAAARREFGQAIDWPDLAGALALRICERHGLEYPESWLADIQQSERPDFRRAPVIATYGLVLEKVCPGVRDAWVVAIETLRGRAAFPGDRGSFDYSPRELVGVACGLASLVADPHGHVEWFANLLIRGLASEHFHNPQLRVAAMMALNHVDPAKGRCTGGMVPDIKTLGMRELLLVARLSLAVGGEDILPGDVLEAAFETRLADDRVRVTDVSEAAAFLYLCRRILDKLPFRNASASSLDTVLVLCRRFHLFAIQLGRRHAGRDAVSIQDEYDVQDLFHAILLLHFDDVRAEEVTPSYAEHSSRVDFYLPDARLVVEVKMTRQSLRQRQVADELIEDAARYAAMERVDTLVCLVYDPSNLCPNPTTLEHDVAESGRKLAVHAVVCPRGV